MLSVKQETSKVQRVPDSASEHQSQPHPQPSMLRKPVSSNAGRLPRSKSEQTDEEAVKSQFDFVGIAG